MNKDLTELIFVVDRSGSMFGRHVEAQGGVNGLIEQQQKGDGQCNVTLVEFDDKIDFVCENQPADNVREYELHPRGSTSLLDAIGTTITKVKERHRNTFKGDKPGVIMMTIVTDGGENTSKEYNKEKIEKLIKEQEAEGWNIEYLSCDLSAVNDAAQYGFNTSNIHMYGRGTGCFDMMCSGMSARTSRVRSASAYGLEVNCSYTQDELQAMK